MSTKHEAPSMIRVLIVAAYASVRAGLHGLLAGAGDIAVVAEASGSAEAERLLPGARLDVVLADDLPDDRDRLLSVVAGGECALVLLGATRDGFQALASAPLPGWAYLLKDADGAEIAGAIRAASAGLVALDRSLLPTPGSWAAPPAGPAPSGGGLTAREREVLALMARGLPNKQIAARLAISPHTAKFHVASVLAKLGAASRTEAVTLGARLERVFQIAPVKSGFRRKTGSPHKPHRAFVTSWKSFCRAERLYEPPRNLS